MMSVFLQPATEGKKLIKIVMKREAESCYRFRMSYLLVGKDDQSSGKYLTNSDHRVTAYQSIKSAN